MGGPFHDLTGKRFGRLVVLEWAGMLTRGRQRLSSWLCRCDCGSAKVIKAEALLNGRTQSCGCFRDEKTSATATTHGLFGTPTYNTWASMIQRCNNPRTPRYKDYGGRGIKVAFASFEHFVAHVGERPPGMTIDRIDPNGNYAPGNVRWATARTQARNHRVPPKLKDEDVPRLVALRDSGATWRAIGETFGISATTAFGYYSRYKQ